MGKSPFIQVFSSFSSFLDQCVRHPVKTFEKPVACGGAASLDVPLAVAEAVQAQPLRHLSSRHGVGQILLVGIHKQDRITELVLVEHAVQLENN